MKAVRRRSDHRVAFRIESHDGDRIPVSGVPRPAPRGSCPGMLVERIASPQERMVLTGMSLCAVSKADDGAQLLACLEGNGTGRCSQSE